MVEVTHRKTPTKMAKRIVHRQPAFFMRWLKIRRASERESERAHARTHARDHAPDAVAIAVP